MKKFSIIILILLPFFLIYFVSLAGKISSTYSSTKVEEIVLRDKEHVFEKDEILDLEVGDDHFIMIEIQPENASNKQYKTKVIDYDNNDEEDVISYNNHGLITANKAGDAKLIFTSLSNTSIEATLNVHVRDDQMRDFSVPKELTIKVGGDAQIEVTFDPIGTVDEQRGLTFRSENNNIATVDSYGKVKGISVGETNIVVKSLTTGKEKLVRVTVTQYASGDARFTIENEEGLSFAIYNQSDTIHLFDYVEIKNGNKSNFCFDVLSDKNPDEIDVTNLQNDGILVFKKPGVIVRVGLFRKDPSTGGVKLENKLDEVTIKYIAN